MKKYAAVALVTAALAVAPFASAQAEGWRHGGPGFGGPRFHHGEYRHHHRGHGPGPWPLFGVLAGVTGAAILASSFNEAPPPPPAPVYVAPAPVVYAQQAPVVQRTVVYPAQSYTTTYYGY
ncbi:MAG: hypothetical protein PHW76_01910 [Alphaproteobacteria bacterium]|nr:hypothetical protein [Alphaproteobacteria bacterium]